MPQNFTQLGIDVSAFSPDKEATLNRFIAIFKELDTYGNKSVNPVFGTGLVEFNNSVSATSKLLGDLNDKITSLNSALSGASGGSKQAAAATKELTVAGAALKLQIAEEDREIKEYVKSKNSLYQARLKEKQAIIDEKKVKADLSAQDKKDAAAFENLRKQAIAQNNEINRSKKQVAQSTQEESRATQKLISDYELLKLAQKDQITNYTNLYITKGGGPKASNNPEVKEALADLTATSTTINDIEKNLGKATQGAGAFGNSLTRGLSGLRTLAYILPGIGIAGIFNLAFEAIAKAAEELGLFNNETLKTLDRETKVNQSLLEQKAILQDIKDQREKLFQLVDPRSSSNQARSSKIDESIGYEQGIQLNNKLFDAQVAFNESKNKLEISSLVPGKIDDDRIAAATERIKFFIQRQTEIDKLLNSVTKIANAKDETNAFKNFFGTNLFPTSRVPDPTFKRKVVDGQTYYEGQDELEALAKKRKSELEIEKTANEKSLQELADYIDNGNTLKQAQIEKDKFYAEEKRKIIFETAKQDISVQIEADEIILNKEISSEAIKAQELKNIAAEKKRINDLEVDYIVHTVGSTESQVAIAQNKAADDNKKIQLKLNQDLINLHESYRQERIKDISESAQSEIEAIAQRDLKIKNNEQNSLEDRLAALTRYIASKQKEQDIQLKKDLDQDKYKTGDETARLGRDSLISKSQEEKANIQADVEKQVYDIVYQSTQKQLKLIEDENKLTISKNRDAYGEQVRDLTDSYRKKQISYTKYKEELKKIDDQFQASSLDQTINQDQVAVDRLQENLKKNVGLLANAEQDKQSKQQLLINAKEGGTQEDILYTQADFDKAEGLYEGYLKAVQNGEISLKNALDKLHDDEFKRNNLRLTEDLKKRREWFQAIKQIEQSLYNAIKQTEDQNYEYKLKKLNEAKAITDEQYDSEISAIEKSSLTAKDKAALDIQLNEQKRQYDRDILREQKQLAHDKAVYDRDLAIAHIIFSTAEAVASLIAVPVLAIAAGVAGASELVVAENVHIPSYKLGTEYHPGGVAKYGEDGLELVKKPYQSPYLVSQETIGWLPRGTQVIPLKGHPEFKDDVIGDGWDQTRWLAKQIKKAMPQKEKQVNNIYINLGFESYKKRILGN